MHYLIILKCRLYVKQFASQLRKLQRTPLLHFCMTHYKVPTIDQNPAKFITIIYKINLIFTFLFTSVGPYTESPRLT
jgi:hypothetical protein